MQNKVTILKTIIYRVSVIFILLLPISIASCQGGLQTATSDEQPKHHEWTKAEKDDMTKECIENAKKSYANDPEGTTSLCECATEKLTSKYTYDQAQELKKKPLQIQMDSIMSIVKDCKEEMKLAK